MATMTKLQEIVQSIQDEYLKSELPEIRVGDMVRIGVSIQEGNKQRIQPFEGTVIAQHKAGLNSTLTVRKSLQGVSVERVFPLHGPCITSLQIIRRAQVSRAKLYYLRNRTGKATRLKEKFESLPPIWVQVAKKESTSTEATSTQSNSTQSTSTESNSTQSNSTQSNK